MVGKWLLCDFHIHTTFSDGSVALEETVNLYGGKGFDVIGISDHILDEATVDRCRARGAPVRAIEKDRFPEYLRSLWKEARKAWEEFGLLMIPGVEITNNTQGYHILAIDIKEYIEPGLS